MFELTRSFDRENSTSSRVSSNPPRVVAVYIRDRSSQGGTTSYYLQVNVENNGNEPITGILGKIDSLTAVNGAPLPSHQGQHCAYDIPAGAFDTIEFWLDFSETSAPVSGESSYNVTVSVWTDENPENVQMAISEEVTYEARPC
ncbi:MAG: hypothetical protein AAFR61_12290 [Bacteroidota bacterium]